MKRNRTRNEDGEEEEEEREFLINVKVVEYLQPVMSKELLCKFPDNSAYDFDYSQSSLWSPLIPRTYSPMDLMITPMKQLSTEDLEFDNQKKSSQKKKKKMKMMTAMASSPAFRINNFLKTNIKKTMKNKKIKPSDFSPLPVKTSCLPISSKGWSKLLKAASKHFKKKKKDAGVHVKLSNSLGDGGKLI